MEHTSRVILITGYAYDKKNNFIGVKQVGKDTFAELLGQAAAQKYNVVHISFAEELRTLAKRLYGLTDEQMSITKEEELKEYPGFTPRKILELLGTDAIRSEHGMNMDGYWIDCVIRKIYSMERILSVADNCDPNNVRHELFRSMRQCGLPETNIKPQLYLITDCRFPNEYTQVKQKLKQFKPICVQMKRCLETPQKPNTHPSNRFYKCMIPDVTIENNGTMTQLLEIVNHFFQQQL
jgi:hypothetical protein